MLWVFRFIAEISRSSCQPDLRLGGTQSRLSKCWEREAPQKDSSLRGFALTLLCQFWLQVSRPTPRPDSWNLKERELSLTCQLSFRSQYQEENAKKDTSKSCSPRPLTNRGRS